MCVSTDPLLLFCAMDLVADKWKIKESTENTPDTYVYLTNWQESNASNFVNRKTETNPILRQNSMNSTEDGQRVMCRVNGNSWDNFINIWRFKTPPYVNILVNKIFIPHNANTVNMQHMTTIKMNYVLNRSMCVCRILRTCKRKVAHKMRINKYRASEISFLLFYTLYGYTLYL